LKKYEKYIEGIEKPLNALGGAFGAFYEDAESDYADRGNAFITAITNVNAGLEGFKAENQYVRSELNELLDRVKNVKAAIEERQKMEDDKDSKEKTYQSAQKSGKDPIKTQQALDRFEEIQVELERKHEITKEIVIDFVNNLWRNFEGPYRSIVASQVNLFTKATLSFGDMCEIDPLIVGVKSGNTSQKREITTSRDQPPAPSRDNQPPPIVTRDDQPPPITRSDQPPPITRNDQPPPITRNDQPPPITRNDPPPVTRNEPPPVTRSENTSSGQKISKLPFIQEKERIKYATIFQREDAENIGSLTGEKSFELFVRSKLDNQLLGVVWELADQDIDGQLDLDEFTLAMYLINAKIRGEIEIPSTLPDDMVIANY